MLTITELVIMANALLRAEVKQKLAMYKQTYLIL